jgi:hypothetical protein
MILSKGLAGEESVEQRRVMSKSRRECLLRYSDPNYEVPENWTTDSLTQVEAKRLAKNAYTARIAVDVPRRLGSDASGYELSADKKLSKRIAYVYFNLWTRFVRAPHATLPLEECPDDLVPPRNWKALHTLAYADEEIRRAGSTIIWTDGWEELSPRLHARRMVVASVALTRGETAWGYRMIVSLTDEINWLDRKFDLYNSQMKRIGV